MEYRLSNNDLTITFSTLGAEMVSVICHGKERLWQNDNGAWTGHAPVLFPFPGRCLFDYKGKDYPMNQHGLARRMEFELLSLKENRIHFILDADEASMALYPFKFRLEIIYTIHACAVKVEYVVTNLSHETMPFSIGCHDSYALEKDVSHYEVQFEAEEVFHALDHTKDGHLPGTYKDLGVGRTIDLGSPLLNDGNTIIQEGIHSRKTVLVDKDTKKAIASVSFPNFGNFLLWHPPLSKMICMEPWLTLSDEVNKTKSFSEKKNVIRLAPRDSKSFVHIIDYIG